MYWFQDLSETARPACRVKDFGDSVDWVTSIMASARTRPSMGRGGVMPRIWATVGATSLLAEGRVLTKPGLKSGPAAMRVFRMS